LNSGVTFGRTRGKFAAMKTSSLICAFSLLASIALVSCSKADQTNNPPATQTINANSITKEQPATASPGFADPAKLTEKAPETFKVRFDTTKGKFTVEVTRSLAPNGADRFYNLVKSDYFADIGFFRVVPGFMVQFGIHGDPAVSAKWRTANISDDPVKGSNTRGTITFATAGPNTRTTQMFINFADNTFLDGQGFSPFGKVISGMDVVDRPDSNGRQRVFETRIPEPRLHQVRNHRVGGIARKERFNQIDFMSEAAHITTTEGEMVIEFWSDVAPKTVENFRTLAQKGFYDGTCFHRIIKGFMIQGGDPLTKDASKESHWGTGGPGYQIKAEFNDRSHQRGVISMARSQHPDSAGSQFFICDGDASFLDRQYTAFGKLIRGEDVLAKIAGTPVGSGGSGERSKPQKRVGVISVKIAASDAAK
jgi:peptidyl-prolyl cis-trans isomerase B (cyclophilin B)